VGACGVQLQPLVEALREELLAQPVLHADETPVQMLKPGHGKTHRSYLWSYCTTAYNPVKAVVFDFAESRAGRHAGQFLADWRGTLVCDDYSGYKCECSASWSHSVFGIKAPLDIRRKGATLNPAWGLEPSSMG